MDLKEQIRQIPDFPKPGILFYDISTLLRRTEAFQEAIEQLAEIVAPHRPDHLVGIESRGFIFAAPLALRLGIGFAMIRKRGKLPGSVVGHVYDLEYGGDTIEISADLLPARSRVVIVDDLIATGGTAEGAVKLLRQMGANVLAACFIIDLPDLGGADKIRKLDVPVRTLISFEGH
jgi:adenine phosphoribosyltransferase